MSTGFKYPLSKTCLSAFFMRVGDCHVSLLQWKRGCWASLMINTFICGISLHEQKSSSWFSNFFKSLWGEGIDMSLRIASLRGWWGLLVFTEGLLWRAYASSRRCRETLTALLCFWILKTANTNHFLIAIENQKWFEITFLSILSTWETCEGLCEAFCTSCYLCKQECLYMSTSTPFTTKSWGSGQCLSPFQPTSLSTTGLVYHFTWELIHFKHCFEHFHYLLNYRSFFFLFSGFSGFTSGYSSEGFCSV